MRLYTAIATPLVYDEYQWTYRVDSVSLRPGNVHLPIHGDQHPPGQLYWAAWGTALFGRNLLGYRVGSVILGTLAIPIAFRLGALAFGPAAGLLAALLVGTNEYLIGASSRLCTEKTYLTFALLSILLLENAARRQTRWTFVVLGACFGLGLLTKHPLILWAPVFVLELVRRPESRRVWLTAKPYWGIVACLVIVSPDIYWNLMKDSGTSFWNAGFSFQLTKLGLGWSWGPAALYCRSLIYHLLEPALFDYPALTILPGSVLLGGAIGSLFRLRSAEARLLHILGWSTFLFFVFLGDYPDDYPAFWWADLSILPFSLLTAGLIGQAGAGRWPLTLIVSGVFLVNALQLTQVRDNVYLPDVAPPPGPVVQAARHERETWGIRRRTWGVRDRPVDHVALCRLGRFRLPAWSYYQESYRSYLQALDSMSEEARASFGDWQRERARVQATLRRFEDVTGSRTE